MKDMISKNKMNRKETTMTTTNCRTETGPLPAQTILSPTTMIWRTRSQQEAGLWARH
jgi:hypothetical protein